MIWPAARPLLEASALSPHPNSLYPFPSSIGARARFLTMVRNDRHGDSAPGLASPDFRFRPSLRRSEGGRGRAFARDGETPSAGVSLQRGPYYQQRYSSGRRWRCSSCPPSIRWRMIFDWQTVRSAVGTGTRRPCRRKPSPAFRSSVKIADFFLGPLGLAFTTRPSTPAPTEY